MSLTGAVLIGSLLAPTIFEVEAEAPQEVAVVVLAPDALPGAVSMSELTEALMQSVTGQAFLRPRTLAQMGLLDEGVDSCPSVRLLTCFYSEMKRVPQPPAFALFVSLRASGPEDWAARAIMLPLDEMERGEGQEAAGMHGRPEVPVEGVALQQEAQLQSLAAQTEWVSKASREGVSALFDELLGRLRPDLERWGVAETRAEVRLRQVPEGASVWLDDRLLATKVTGGQLRVRSVPPGTRVIRVELSGRSVWVSNLALAPGELKTLEITVSEEDGLPPELFLGAGLLGLGITVGAVAVVTGLSQDAGSCVPAAGEASCPSAPIALFQDTSLRAGLEADDRGGLSLTPIAVGLSTAGAGSLLAPFVFPETCQRERVWCQLAALGLGAAAGGLTAWLEP